MLAKQKVQRFRDLLVWQSGMKLVEYIYQATEQFPNKEVFGLSAQLTAQAKSRHQPPDT